MCLWPKTFWNESFVPGAHRTRLPTSLSLAASQAASASSLVRSVATPHNHASRGRAEDIKILSLTSLAFWFYCFENRAGLPDILTKIDPNYQLTSGGVSRNIFYWTESYYWSSDFLKWKYQFYFLWIDDLRVWLSNLKKKGEISPALSQLKLTHRCKRVSWVSLIKTVTLICWNSKYVDLAILLHKLLSFEHLLF